MSTDVLETFLHDVASV